VAADLGIDPRTAMELYRALAEEGLVEVRPRSGVYMAGNDSPSPTVSGETARWVAHEVALGSWRRRLPFDELPGFLRRCLDSSRLLCVCIDEIEDDRIAICREIRRDFGLTVRDVEPLGGGRVRARGREQPLLEALDDADLVVVTAYHEREVSTALEGRETPLILTTLNSAGVQEIRELGKAKGPLTFVVVDPQAQRRIAEGFGTDVEVTTVEALDDTDGQRETTLVFTPAAADAVDAIPAGAVVPRSPIVSEETAATLSRWIVHLNLGRAESSSDSTDDPGRG
jgi:hypothetical protein